MAIIFGSGVGVNYFLAARKKRIVKNYDTYQKLFYYWIHITAGAF